MDSVLPKTGPYTHYLTIGLGLALRDCRKGSGKAYRDTPEEEGRPKAQTLCVTISRPCDSEAILLYS